MQPRKFFYEEIVYFGNIYLIEFSRGRLNLQRLQVGEFLISDTSIYTEPTKEDWKEFCDSVKNLSLKPRYPDDNIMDGFQVKCHITFKKVLMKLC